ncbi:Gustatory receptor for sugar taste 64e [Folsomia candida]|uniref:Gustatory receptor for sugar taste 64e n=1 Tax=Folsomia candida TaxID=158441 RepID=A0A226F585_FOLCA|nr:Gustatory receptor for sugar taste 64e [Folsomia candida]
MISQVDITSDLGGPKSDVLGIVRVKPVIENHTRNDKPSLQDKLRYYLIFGRVIGILPIQGVFHRGSKLTFKKFSLASCTTLIIALLIGTYAVVNLIQSLRKNHTNASEIAWAALLPAQYTLGTFCYIIFLINGSKFCNLFSTWKNLSRLHFPVDDTTLSRDVGIWEIIIFISTISATISWPFLRNKIGWDLHYEYQSWNILTLTLNIVTQYAWNYVDILIGIFARVLYGQFKGLRETCKKIVHVDGGIKDEKYLGEDAVFWEFLVNDHGIICQVMESFKEFLSPIILVTFAANVFWICLVVILTPFLQVNQLYKFYAIWSFLHVVVRFFTMALLAARVSTEAHKFADILEQCPIEMYTQKVARFERKLQTGRIALSGMNCFSVTKPLILSVIGVLVTFEIVVLHAIPREMVNITRMPEWGQGIIVWMESDSAEIKYDGPANINDGTSDITKYFK